jgi:hypothetical protein
MDLTGQTLGKYKLIRRLGKGGMAQVYQANQPTIERMVAVKVLHSHLAESDDFVERFKREARGLGQLQHPHIIQVIDFDTANDLYYMVMDYIPGQTLRDYLDEKMKLSNSEALLLIAQLASALEYAHQNGTIHRDIKPANVMFSDASCTHAILTDFGITRLVNEKSITVTGALVGTPAYMSPEAVLGEHVDGRSDIYSLGVILYEMVSGRTPYQGNTPLSLVVKQVHAPLPSILDQNPDVPPALVKLIEKSLAKTADDRYQTVAAFMEDVRDAQLAIGDRPFGATQVSATRHFRAPIKTAVQDAETVTPDAKTAVHTPVAPTNRWLIYAGIGVLLLLIIAGFFWRGSANEAVVQVPTAPVVQEEPTAPVATKHSEEVGAIVPTADVEATAVSTDTSIPTETAVPTETPPPSIPLVVADQTGTLQFLNSDDQIPRTFLLQLDRVLLPPTGFHYALWLETADGRLLNGGVLTVENGRILAEGTRNDNLVILIQRVIISLEPDSNPANATAITGTVVAEGGLPEGYTAVLQQLLSNENNGGRLANALAQAQIARQHAGFAQEAINQNNLVEAKVHAEHVVNILDGETGDRFGDINLDGQAQNPGDGVGVRVYLGESRELLTRLQQMEPLTQNRLFYAEQALAALDNALLTVEASIDQALSMVATDTAAEAEPFVTAVIDQLDLLLSADAAQQTLAGATSHTFVLAQLPLLPLDATLPPPDSVAETIPNRVGILQFSSAEDVIGGAFWLQLNQVLPPDASQQYAAWLHNSTTGESQLLAPIAYHAGQIELSGVGFDNLLTAFDEFVITLQPLDQPEEFAAGTAVYAGSIHSEMGLAILQLLADGTSSKPGLLFGIESQLRIALQHHQFAAESIAANNLVEAKIHAEHVINILDGADGEHFGDLNLDGQAQNPGDGVGVRGYWQQLINGVVALGDLTDVTNNQQFYADRLITTGQTGMDAVAQVIEQAQRLLASDTVAEAQPFLEEMAAALNRVLTGADLDNNGVIDPLLGEGGLADAVNMTLAIHEVSIFPIE